MAAVLLAAPDPLEAEAIRAELSRLGIHSERRTVGVLACTALPELDMLLAVGGNGKAQFGVQTQYLIDRCGDTRLLVCVGAAGGLAGIVRIGDVVVAETTIEHDYKSRFSSKPMPRHDVDSAEVDRFRHATVDTGSGFRVHFGAVASGDEDIVDAERAAAIRAETGALCVAWEGSGGARSARLNGIGFCEVRGITDMADGRAADHFRENISQAMRNVTHLLLAWRRC